jgi:ATP-binding cassette subfamily C protein
MVKALRMFFSAEGANPWMVVLCLVAAGMAEGFGIATLLPLLTVAQGEGAGDNAVGRFVQPLIEGLSYEAAIGALLAVVLLGILLKVSLSMLAMRYVGYSVAEVSTRLRTRMIRQILAVRWGYLVRHASGRFINAVSSQVGAMVEGFRAAAALVATLIQTAMLLAWPSWSRGRWRWARSSWRPCSAWRCTRSSTARAAPGGPRTAATASW